MDKFATLEPVKLYSPPSSSRFLSRPSVVVQPIAHGPLIGRLPIDLHLLLLQHLPLPDIPAYARCSRSTSKLVQDDSIWEARWKALLIEESSLATLLDDLEAKPPRQDPPHDDEFGDFASGGNSDEFSPPTSLSFTFPPLPSDKDVHKVKFQRVHRLLRKLLPALSSPPHLVLSGLFDLLPSICKSLNQQARTLDNPFRCLCTKLAGLPVLK